MTLTLSIPIYRYLRRYLTLNNPCHGFPLERHIYTSLLKKYLKKRIYTYSDNEQNVYVHILTAKG